jgi:hypothetical protein
MAEKKVELVKNIMINLGILLILVSSLASKDAGFTPFFLGLILLAMQIMDFRVEPKKLVTAEIILATSLSLATIVQLVMSKSFGQPQVFMMILLLGGILITVEAVRKYADL